MRFSEARLQAKLDKLELENTEYAKANRENYAEIKYDIIYDEEILSGKLSEYDWLHLHHEDFTGQYGKFYAAYHNMAWYKERQFEEEQRASKLGFNKPDQWYK